MGEIEQQLTSYTFRLLGRRDYSRYELKQKLLTSYKIRAKKDNLGGNNQQMMATVEGILDYFQEADLQDDYKFAAIYVKQGIEKGWGPIKIKQKLYAKGLAQDIVSNQLNLDDDFWLSKALAVASRRYTIPFADIKEKEKCYRFLISRGFSSTHARGVINSSN